MHHPTAPIIPILDKSYLFVHVPTDPQNPSRRYLQCPATGHLYCTSTGSLYQKMTIPLSVNISPLLNLRKNSGLLPSISTPCTIKTFSVCTNNDNQQDNGASTSIESKKSPEVKDVKQPIQGNSALMSNIVPNVKNAHQQMQSTRAPKTPKTRRNKASKSKVDTPTQVNSTVQGASNSSACSRSKSDPTTKKEKKKRTKKTKTKSVPLLDNSSATPKEASASRKQKKSTVTPQPKFTRSFRNDSYSSFIKPAPIRQTTNQCKAVIHPDYNFPAKNTRKSYTYYKFYLNHMIKFIQPIQIKFEDLLFPQNASLELDRNFFSRKPAEENTKIIKVCSLSNPKYKCSPKCTRREKPPSLCFSNQDYITLCVQNNLKKKTAKKKKSGPVSQSFKTLWALLRPFNRRPHPHHNRQKSLLSSKYKNCIMAFSVHEIIHSRFAKNTNEHMPVSQVRAMLSSGDRKLRTRNEWIQQMEEEAIHKYKKMKLEKHKQRLQVKEYDVLHHPEKSWLVSYGRWVINRKDEERWPLLVKCLHKYPDSTLRQACKHRSFCLRWNGTSYTLRMDHAYYTQIQCHMAVTETPYAELIVHTHKETTFLPVYFDCDFWKQTEATLETFFTSNVQPYLEKIESNPVNVALESDVSNVIIEE